MKLFRNTQIAASWVAALLIGVSSHGQCRYEVTEMVFSGQPFIGLAMNDHGHVVGYINPIGGNDRAAYWSKSTGVVELTLPGAFNSRATGINNDDTIVGWQDTRENGDAIGKRAFVIENGIYTRIDPLSGGNSTEASAVNDGGVVVGTWGNIATGPLHVFSWSSNTFTDLNLVVNAEQSFGLDINRESQITGWSAMFAFESVRGFIIDQGSLTEIDPIPGGINSEGDAINNLGHVAGRGFISVEDALWRAIFWDGKTVTDLGTLPGTTRSIARDINDPDQIVGYCHNEFQGDITPFLWQNGVMHNLQDQLEGASEVELSIPRAVLNDGRILCTGGTTDGQAGGFVVLSPVNTSPADINNDCVVDRHDLILLLEQWNTTDTFADVDGNSIVNVFDLLDLLFEWG